MLWNRMHNDPSRSSKVVDFGTNRKRAYGTFWCSLYSIATYKRGPILPVSEILQLLYAESHFFTSPPFSQRKFRMFPLEIRDLGVCKQEKAISCEINFRRIPTMWPRYLNVTDGQIDRWTICRSNTGVTALCVASRGKNQDTASTTKYKKDRPPSAACTLTLSWPCYKCTGRAKKVTPRKNFYISEIVAVYIFTKFTEFTDEDSVHISGKYY